MSQPKAQSSNFLKQFRYNDSDNSASNSQDIADAIGAEKKHQNGQITEDLTSRTCANDVSPSEVTKSQEAEFTNHTSPGRDRQKSSGKSIPTAVVPPKNASRKNKDDDFDGASRFRLDFVSAGERFTAKNRAKKLKGGSDCESDDEQNVTQNDRLMDGETLDESDLKRAKSELKQVHTSAKLSYNAAMNSGSPNTTARRHMDIVLQPFRRHSSRECGRDAQSSTSQLYRPYRGTLTKRSSAGDENSAGNSLRKENSSEFAGDEQFKHFDAKLLEMIASEIMVQKLDVSWEEICGLENVKAALKEIVIWPFLRPELFHGVRTPSKGVLLFGPPGTGKTMIGKCVASQCGATFFNISASSLTSKWVGEGEKLVRALFALARSKIPAVIFIDEIDSLLAARSDTEHESSRRIKTEFLVQLDGLATSADERLLVLGATNRYVYRPHELDEAARRRFTKRLYVPLPNALARTAIVKKLLEPHTHSLSNEDDFTKIGQLTEGYSGSDVRALTQEASYGPLREIGDITDVDAEKIRPISVCDFEKALQQVKPTVGQKDLQIYEQFDRVFGTNSRNN